MKQIKQSEFLYSIGPLNIYGPYEQKQVRVKTVRSGSSSDILWGVFTPEGCHWLKDQMDHTSWWEGGDTPDPAALCLLSILLVKQELKSWFQEEVQHGVGGWGGGDGTSCPELCAPDVTLQVQAKMIFPSSWQYGYYNALMQALCLIHWWWKYGWALRSTGRIRKHVGCLFMVSHRNNAAQSQRESGKKAPALICQDFSHDRGPERRWIEEMKQMMSHWGKWKQTNSGS